MKSQTYGLATVFIVLTFFLIPAFAQTDRLTEPPVNPWTNSSSSKQSQSIRVGGGAESREKYGFYWETRLEPAMPALADGFSTGTTDNAGMIHRVVLDRSGRTYFGYDVMVDILPDPNTYRVTFRPLTMTLETARGLSMERWNEWTPLSMRFPAPQTIHGGDIIELTLLINNLTNQKILDYVSIQDPVKRSAFEETQKREFTYATGVARDIAPTDIEMRIVSPRLSINGKLEQSTTIHFEEVAGPFVWIYPPNHGRFIFSLLPHPELGFSRAGEIRGSTMEFKIGSDSFTLSTGAQIAPGQAVLNLYVLHEPEWKPSYLFADLSAFNMGAGDRIESLIGK